MEPSRHDGLAELHRRYYPELVRLAFALTGDWSLAEELGQAIVAAGLHVGKTAVAPKKLPRTDVTSIQPTGWPGVSCSPPPFSQALRSA